MTARELEKTLRKERRIVMIPSAFRGSGLYLRQNDPDDQEDRGLKFLCGIPSPRFVKTIPKLNYIDDDGQWVRGLKSICRNLALKRTAHGTKMFSTKLIRSICPGFDLGETGARGRDNAFQTRTREKRKEREKFMSNVQSKALGSTWV